MLLPEELGKELENKGIYPIQEGAKVSEEISKPAIDALNYFRDQQVDGIILGCTEIPILLGDKVYDSDIINPSKLIAEKVIKETLIVKQ